MKTYTVTTVYSFKLTQEVEAHNEEQAQDIAIELDSQVSAKGLLDALAEGWSYEASFVDELTEGNAV